MGRKEDLKVLFETGKIPFGQDFAQFIDESFNNYKVVDMFNPNIAPNTFDEGESVLVFKYDPNANPDWANLFGPLVGAGDVMVRTLAYPNANIWLQEFDTDRNGRYYANYSRGSTDGVTWSGLINHPRVDTVNGVGPDVNGNIQLTIPPGGITVIDGLTSTSATDALSANQGNVLALITQGLTNDLLLDRAALNNHIDTVASPTVLGHVKIDGTTITIDNGVISAAGGSAITVVDNLDSQSPTDALSANQGRTLWYLNVAANGRIDALDADLYSYETRLNQHIAEVASETNLGHVKIDGTSITIDNGVISATPSDITVIDALDSDSRTDALSANQGKQLEEGLHNLYIDTVNISRRVTSAQEDIDNHIPERGTDADFGHVKVDGTTIVSSNGVISAVGLSPAGVVIDNLTSTSATDSLSANQGRVLDGKLVNHSRVVATDTVLGHVMVDDDTIKVTSYGEISVDFTRIDQELAMLESEIMQDASRLVGLTNDFDNHVQTKATDTVLGHVKVDGVTIEANNGVISAVTPPAPVIVNNLTSTATNESLSANQGRVIKGLIDTATSSLQTQIGRINDNESAIDALETATMTLNNKKTLYFNASGAVTQQMKVFNAIAVVAGNAGLFTVDLTPAAFTSVVSVQMTPINGGASDANAPMAAQVRGLSNTSVGGKAFKASSAGLLAAMQQVVADEGTQIYVTVHGY